jgi:hypothetical protein
MVDVGEFNAGADERATVVALGAEGVSTGSHRDALELRLRPDGG